MHGNRNADVRPTFRIDVMAPVNALPFPPFRFQYPAQLLAAYGFQAAISTTLSLFDRLMSCRSTDKQPSTASWILLSNSSKVRPWVAQPGMAGTSA